MKLIQKGIMRLIFSWLIWPQITAIPSIRRECDMNGTESHLHPSGKRGNVVCCQASHTVLDHFQLPKLTLTAGSFRARTSASPNPSRPARRAPTTKKRSVCEPNPIR